MCLCCSNDGLFHCPEARLQCSPLALYSTARTLLSKASSISAQSLSTNLYCLTTSFSLYLSIIEPDTLTTLRGGSLPGTYMSSCCGGWVRVSARTQTTATFPVRDVFAARLVADFVSVFAETIFLVPARPLFDVLEVLYAASRASCSFWMASSSSR